MTRWSIRLIIVLFILCVFRAAPPLALTLVGAAALCALALYLHEGRYLPRFVMDILDRLTNRSQLERAYEARHAQLVTIDAEDLGRRVKGRVIGQDATIEAIAQQIRRRIAARRHDKPLAVFCLAGAPGTGKTHLAKVLAEELFGTRNQLHFFDMSQFGQPHAAATLFGQARGYVGSNAYGALTAALRDMPNAIVLLDEFEKAHPEVHKRFLTAWNDGFVTEASDGAKVSTADAIFILTTNAASMRIGEIATDANLPPEEVARLSKAALADAQFAPEVLSRIDQVFAFRPLRGLDIARVVALEIEAVAKQFGLSIEHGGIDASILLSAVEDLQGRMGGGVRDVARAIEHQVTDQLIDCRTQGAKSIRLVAGENGRVRVLTVESANVPAPAAPPVAA